MDGYRSRLVEGDVLPGLAPLDAVDRGEVDLVVTADGSGSIAIGQTTLDLQHLLDVKCPVRTARLTSLTLRLRLSGGLGRFDCRSGAIEVDGLGRSQERLDRGEVLVDGLDTVRQSTDLCVREDGKHCAR